MLGKNNRNGRNQRRNSRLAFGTLLEGVSQRRQQAIFRWAGLTDELSDKIYTARVGSDLGLPIDSSIHSHSRMHQRTNSIKI